MRLQLSAHKAVASLTLYHGFSSEYLEAIQKDGLIPKRGQRRRKMVHGSDAISLTSDYNLAVEFAEHNCYGFKPCVAVCSVAESDLEVDGDDLAAAIWAAICFKMNKPQFLDSLENGCDATKYYTSSFVQKLADFFTSNANETEKYLLMPGKLRKIQHRRWPAPIDPQLRRIVEFINRVEFPSELKHQVWSLATTFCTTKAIRPRKIIQL